MHIHPFRRSFSSFRYFLVASNLTFVVSQQRLLSRSIENLLIYQRYNSRSIYARQRLLLFQSGLASIRRFLVYVSGTIAFQ